MGQHYLNKLYKAVFSAAYYGLLRIGELTFSQHCLLAHNVHIGKNKEKLLFILNSLKTHSRGQKPQLIKIASTPIPAAVKDKSIISKKHCPYSLIHDFIAIRPAQLLMNEPFFVFADRSPLPSAQLNKVLKALITRMGLNPKPYSMHSYHGSRASDLLKLGVSVETIKKIGCWKSNAVFTYLRD